MNTELMKALDPPAEKLEYGGKELELTNLATALVDPPKPPEEVIKQILRRGHKMMVTASSKAGKTWLMIELACAIASGQMWLGYFVKRGKVLYLNMELSESSFINRFKIVADKMKLSSADQNNIDFFSLRGVNGSFDELAELVAHVVKENQYIMVIIDPIYKLFEGSENDQEAVTLFCNNLDVIANAGASVVYTHHHSKGAQAGKSAMDRGSGSGVFARDADALMDLLEVDCPEELQEKDKTISAYQVEWTLREFKPRPITGITFDYPIHKPDPSGAVLDSKPKSNQRRGGTTTGQINHERREAKKAEFVEAFSEGVTTLDGMKARLDVGERTVKNYAKDAGYVVFRGNITQKVKVE